MKPSRSSVMSTITYTCSSLRVLVSEQLVLGEDRLVGVAVLGKQPPGVALAIYDRDDLHDGAARVFDRFDGLDHRFSGGNHVIHDHDPGPLGQFSFDELLRAVALGLFAHPK